MRGTGVPWCLRLGVLPPNNTLQATYDPLPIFDAAKMLFVSNAPERRR